METPPTAPRPGVWSSEPRPLRRTARKVPGWWVPFAFGPMLYDSFAHAFGGYRPPWLAGVQIFGFLLWGVLVLVWRASETLALRTTRHDRAFSDLPPGIVEHRIELSILAQGREIGVDRGIVWFEDGLFRYHGVACSFSLAAADFEKPLPAMGFVVERALPKDALRLRAPVRDAHVRLRPLSGWRKPAFSFALRRFFREASPPRGSRQWPPLAPYGTLASSSRVNLDTPERIGVEAAREGIARGVVRP